MGKITINEIHKSLFGYIQAVSDESLETKDKTIVGAINELIQNSNSNKTELNNLINEISNGKQLIANAIGEPLSSDQTFQAMSTDINGLLSTFKANMMNNGVTVNSGDKFKALIDKIATLADNEGNKVQFATGFINTTANLVGTYTTWNWIKNSFTFDSPLDFTPTRIILSFPMLGLSQSIADKYYLDNYTVDSQMCYDENNTFHAYESNCNSSIALYITNISNTGFDLYATKYTENYPLACPEGIDWLAIGVGEEDTTLRDSLANILENKGVDVTEEDDMASLITKVDSIETGGGLDISIVESLPDTVTENKLCVIAPVTDGMIYVDRLDKDEAVSTYSFNTDDYFVRLVLSESTNTFVTTSTSGNVVEKYLIGGIYRYDGSGLVLADNIYKGSNGEWVQIFDVLLVFSNGLQNGTRIVNSESSSCKGYVSGGGTTLTLKYLSIGATDIAFKNSLDITDYNKLVLVVESTSFSTSSSSLISFDLYDSTDTYVNVGLDTTVGDINGWTKGQLIEIDVSSLSGPHYLRVNKQAVNINGTIVLSEIYFTK